MRAEAKERDRGEPAPLDRVRPQSSPISSRAANRNKGQPPSASKESTNARAEAPQARLPAERRIVEVPPSRPDEHAEQDHERADESRRSMLGRHSRAVVIGLIVFALTAPTGFLYWGYARHFESSDDAFIAARQFPIAPKVSGYITAVPVTDNQHIASGDVIARIDERDYRIALEQAQAQVANAKANIQNIDAQTNVQQAQIASNQAQVEQAKAALVFAQQQANRYTDLAKKGWDPVQTEQQYASQLRQQQAALDSAEANLKLAQRQIESLKAQRDSAVANLQQAQAQRDQAQLNLSYTTISAAQAGRVVNLTAAAGQFAQPGTNLSIFVPDEIWVVANFKEPQLDAMRPGQPVTVRIDAYPERIFRGHVASVQPGSGTAFSLLPAENATGNYVKIVQRVCQCGTAVHRGQHGGERRRGVLG